MTKRLRQYGRSGDGRLDGALHRAIVQREDFTAGALRGVTVDHWTDGAGRAEGLTRDAFREDEARGLISFVVYSYATPIAWYSRAGLWVIAEDSYSVTTTRHCGIVRVALRHEPQSAPTLDDSYNERCGCGSSVCAPCYRDALSDAKAAAQR